MLSSGNFPLTQLNPLQWRLAAAANRFKTFDKCAAFAANRALYRIAVKVLFGVCLSSLGACAAAPETRPEVLEQPIESESAPATLPVASDDDEQAIGSLEVDDTTIYIPPEPVAPGPVSKRVRAERRAAFNPYVITAHKHNFILPVSYSSRVNEQIYQQNDVPLREGLLATEVKFQISLKSQLNENDLFFPRDALSLGITLEAWWQLYSDDLSSPFRETNYQPEVFYLLPLSWRPLGGNTSAVFGLEHQSNGQVQGLSRSWNRLYAGLVYEKGSLVASIRPWYRLPEKAKVSPDVAEGDDNPDITDYMGYGDISISWRDETFEYAVFARGNPSTGKGAIELGMTFPLFARFRGYVQYFNGYGDSLIDYDHFQQRLGLGVALTNLY